jgi:hypothetical protein
VVCVLFCQFVDGTKAFASLLLVNSTLTSLNILRNGISVAAATALLQVLMPSTLHYPCTTAAAVSSGDDDEMLRPRLRQITKIDYVLPPGYGKGLVPGMETRLPAIKTKEEKEIVDSASQRSKHGRRVVNPLNTSLVTWCGVSADHHGLLRRHDRHGPNDRVPSEPCMVCNKKRGRSATRLADIMLVAAELCCLRDCQQIGGRPVATTGSKTTTKTKTKTTATTTTTTTTTTTAVGVTKGDEEKGQKEKSEDSEEKSDSVSNNTVMAAACRNDGSESLMTSTSSATHNITTVELIQDWPDDDGVGDVVVVGQWVSRWEGNYRGRGKKQLVAIVC